MWSGETGWQILVPLLCKTDTLYVYDNVAFASVRSAYFHAVENIIYK